jgi:hypothetical protein
LKRVIFDHNVPARLSGLLKAFDIELARNLGWQELHNGKLLRACEESGFDVMPTGDKSMPDEQTMRGRKIGLVCMSANNWNIVRNYVPAIAEAIYKVKPGQVLPVFCGQFKPNKFRKNFDPRL